jgi:hypothetical protein
MATAAEALKRFGAKLGFDDFALGRNGVCALNVEGLEIFFHGDPDETNLRITGVVGDLHAGGLPLARMLLELNWGGALNGPSAFAADPVTGDVLLTRELPVGDMASQEFFAAVEDFVARVEFWSDYLSRLEKSGEPLLHLESVPDEFFLRA